MAAHRHRCEVAVLERTSTTARYTRGFAAAVVTVATLILAANAGPAKASAPHHTGQVAQPHRTPENTTD
ncbi:hypothetical protein OHT57_25720 [Streptomyces sp. NBC_00285]|uniref:hypothetical protein n=1 Tax=Streptomyces sp. NBC_00285 TaxID=2975700 RepID=UPI002E2850B5|nr:hypothetical protein [Streptomyces sp. NBC_00285]